SRRTLRVVRQVRNAEHYGPAIRSRRTSRMASRRLLARLASIETGRSHQGAEDHGHRLRGPRWLIACPRFPLPPNGCAVTASVADAGLRASRSKCAEVR